MKNKKLILILILVALTAAFSILAVACSKEAGDASNSASQSRSGSGGADAPVNEDASLIPTDLSVDLLGKATWSRVSSAVGYEVEVNGAVVTTKFANYDLLSSEALPTDGAFSIKVRSVTDNAKSGWSETLSYAYSGGAVVTPSIDGIDGATLTWTRPTFTAYKGIEEPKPVLTIGGTQAEIPADASSYDLSSASSGEIDLYYKADGVYYKDSKKIRLDYDAASKSLSFCAPEKAYMDGDMLRFDEVVGANIYYLLDVYNTVTSISGSDILAFSSDRDRHFLIQAIRAGNTDLPIADSEYTPVTYFTEEQGSGTEADPYRITTASQMRFIEYYEAKNEAKYYRLENDIVFEDYVPANDEDYSNFYNLGSLSGVIDGNGKTLKNVVVYYKDGYSAIFDNVTKNGVIKNLKIENTRWRTWTNRTNDGIMHNKGGNCAILAYTSSGTIENVTLVSGSVTAARDGAAGLVSVNRGVIRNCVVEKDFTVYGANEAGAFATFNEGTIESCFNYGKVGGKSTVGGIVGRNAGKVYRCGNEGRVTADVYGGGIVGYNYNVFDGVSSQYATLVSECYNKGQVSSTAYAGGIVGRNGSDGYNETGVEAYADAGVYGCYNQGPVSGIISVGGLVGQNYGYEATEGEKKFGVKGCYSSGDVNYNVDGFEANRIYLSVAACSWAEVDSPDIYVYYWADGTSPDPAFPGVKMSKVTIGTATFYSTKLPSYKATGVIFSRVDALSGAVYNSTADLAASGNNTLIYYINADFTGADLVRPCAGALTGYNNMINDCRFVENQPIGGTTERLHATVGGTADTAVAVSKEALRTTVADELNQALGEETFVNVDGKYPVLAWEIQ